MTSETGKTKDAFKGLQNLSALKTVLISSALDKNFDKATRNISTCRYYSVDGLNVYDLLKFNNAIISKDSLAAISKRCGVEK